MTDIEFTSSTTFEDAINTAIAEGWTLKEAKDNHLTFIKGGQIKRVLIPIVINRSGVKKAHELSKALTDLLHEIYLD